MIHKNIESLGARRLFRSSTGGIEAGLETGTGALGRAECILHTHTHWEPRAIANLQR